MNVVFGDADRMFRGLNLTMINWSHICNWFECLIQVKIMMKKQRYPRFLAPNKYLGIILCCQVFCLTTGHSQTLDFPVFDYERMNSDWFSGQDLRGLKIRKIKGTQVTFDRVLPLSADTLESYWAHLDEQNRFIHEFDTLVEESEILESEFSYSGDSLMVNTITRFTSYLDRLLGEKKTSIYISEKKIKSIYNRQVSYFLSHFVIIDTFLYDANGQISTLIQYWMPKEKGVKTDTIRTDLVYNSEGRLIEYHKRPIGKIPTILRYNLGCITPFVAHVYLVGDSSAAEKGKDNIFYSLSESFDKSTKVEHTRFFVKTTRFIKGTTLPDEIIVLRFPEETCLYRFEYFSDHGCINCK